MTEITILEVFDYSMLSAETRIVVQQRTEELHAIDQRVLSDLLTMGGKFTQVRDLLRHDKRGGFEGWLDAERFERTFAYKCIHAHAEFGNRSNIAQLQMGMSAFFLLAAPSTPPEVRDHFMSQADAGEPIKHKDVQAAIKANTKKFYVGQRIAYDGRFYQIATLFGGHANLRSMGNTSDTIPNISVDDIYETITESIAARTAKSHAQSATNGAMAQVPTEPQSALLAPPSESENSAPDASLPVEQTHPFFANHEAAFATCIHCGERHAQWKAVDGDLWLCKKCGGLVGDGFMQPYTKEDEQAEQAMTKRRSAGAVKLVPKAEPIEPEIPALVGLTEAEMLEKFYAFMLTIPDLLTSNPEENLVAGEYLKRYRVIISIESLKDSHV